MATHGRNGLRSIGSDFPPRGSGSTGRDAASPGDRKRRTIAALLLLLPLIAGCVRADFEIVLLPDGSGALRADVAYSGKKWPAFFGDPYQSFLTPQGFAGMTPPGFVAWSEPEVTVEDGWRHLETTAWFDDIRRIVFPAKRSDRTPYAALGFSGNPAAGQLRLLSELDSVLARPLPLPSPQEIGMEGVSIPETVMNGIRSQMGTILSGWMQRAGRRPSRNAPASWSTGPAWSRRNPAGCGKRPPRTPPSFVSWPRAKLPPGTGSVRASRWPRVA